MRRHGSTAGASVSLTRQHLFAAFACFAACAGTDANDGTPLQELPQTSSDAVVEPGAASGVGWSEELGAYFLIGEVQCAMVDDDDYSVCNDGGDPSDCDEHEDCTAGVGGLCLSGADGCSCTYQCRTDVDCDSGYACVCSFGDTSRPRCILATCITERDCEGYRCGLSSDRCEGAMTPARAQCHTDSDECQGDADCGPGEQCLLLGGQWRCYEPDICD
jgi:hypothetical protein